MRHNREQKQRPRAKTRTRTRTRIVWQGFVLRIIVLGLLLGLGYGGYFGYKLYRLQKNIVQLAPTQQESDTQQETKGFIATARDIVTQDRALLRGEKDGRINVLLLGMGGEGHKGKDLTDTIMLVSIDPKTYQSSMLSIPRDLYVGIPESGGIHTKINAIYAFETRNNRNEVGKSFASVKKVIKKVTGQDVHYYFALDFEGFKKIIDELGGIDIEVEQDIYDTRYPGPNYSYETFELAKGFQHFDAETALKYSRVRHVAGGDFGRAKRQQQVLVATKRKAFSLKTIANPIKITSIINVLGDNLKTDIQLREIPSFIHFAKNINIYQTTTKVLDAWSADSLLGSTHVGMGGVQAYVLIPRAKNFSQVHDLAENIFDLQKIEKKRLLLDNENASVVVVSKSARDYQKIKNIFNKLGYKKITIKRSLDTVVCDMRENTIISISPERKLFTLDDLIAKLDAEIEYRPSEKEDFDIAVCLTKNTVTYFEKQYQNADEEDEELKEKTIITKDGTVLYSKDNN